jgi:hypothetical protein
MTGETVIEVAVKYRDYLRYTFSHIESARNQEPRTLDERIAHMTWMCEQIVSFVHEDRTDKAFRWLGFLQGAFWVLGLYTIEQAKRDNAPDAVFNKEKV